ncbi:uncharacterized protein LOC100903966 [Galendromus occidentalis]|uniref:Uncharacterized protein LOC100903966 n=1 Tax=Galendromus occidentalis TaxID=34638 RepID=A0AAJ6QP01_9ACAR|nr:uncharacterized protein LOC100903966 [Galendromus occidentalis]
MKPPDPRILFSCALVIFPLLGCATSAQQLPSEAAPQLPPPPLLNVNVPAKSFTRLNVEVSENRTGSPPAIATSTVIAIAPTDAEFENANNATEAHGAVLQPDAEKIPPTEDVVTKTSVQGSVTELIAENEDVGPNDEDPQPVTRTSLSVSEVELGENGQVVSAVTEANLQDAVTKTSLKISQQEIVPASNEAERNSSLSKPNAENIQEILKQIQNEVGEGRILYVADPKGKTGVRIGHQTEAPAQDVEYQDEGDVEYDDYDTPTTTPLSIVQLKKLSLPRNRPTIGRQRPGSQTSNADDNSDHNVIGMKKQKFTRPAFGILQRPKKTTVAPGPRTVRPFVKVFDRAKTRPKTKTVQQLRIRKPVRRITTAKPVRKGFPIGPPKSAIPPDASKPSGPSLADFEEIYRRQKAQKSLTETSTYRTVDEDVPDDFGEPDSQLPLVYYEGQSRISEGWEWSPYLDDRNTKEFKYLAFHVKDQIKTFLDETRYGEFLNYILIDGFTKELNVDFFLVFYKTEPMINDTELTEEIREVMTYKTEENDFEFTLDPNATIFRFKYVKTPATERLVEAPLLPNWAIAILVFGLGSLILVAGSVIMANNFRSIRKLKDIKKRKHQEKQHQLQMSNLPHRYPEVKQSKDRNSKSKSSASGSSSKGRAGSAGTLDRRPPMLERYQRDYGAYEQKNPLQEELYAEYENRSAAYDRYADRERPKRKEIRPLEAPEDRYSTVGSHFPSSYKSLLQPSKSILYRPPR